MIEERKEGKSSLDQKTGSEEKERLIIQEHDHKHDSEDLKNLWKQFIYD